MLTIISSRPKDIAGIASHIPNFAKAIMDHFWPGEITIVFKAKDSIPENLTAGTGKIGVRVPEHPVTRALLEAIDVPITGTSANRSSGMGCSSVSTMNPNIIQKVDLVLDSGMLKGGTGSTVVDVTSKRPVILRRGEISAEEIFDII